MKKKWCIYYNADVSSDTEHFKDNAYSLLGSQKITKKQKKFADDGKARKHLSNNAWIRRSIYYRS